jgi:hypothetical protein
MRVAPQETEFERSDRVAADVARSTYHRATMAPLEPDPAIAPLLSAGELVLAVRRGVAIHVPALPPEPAQGGCPAADLYVTSRRLLLRSNEVRGLELESIQEVAVVGGLLLLSFRDGSAVSLTVTNPRLLQVEIAAARARTRTERGARPGDRQG